MLHIYLSMFALKWGLVHFIHIPGVRHHILFLSDIMNKTSVSSRHSSKIHLSILQHLVIGLFALLGYIDYFYNLHNSDYATA